MRKVLIISYYWPPAGGPAVQRILKFAKFLPEYGWQPIILSVKNGEFPVTDQKFLDEIPNECLVFKSSSFEPYGIYKKFSGQHLSAKIPVAVLTQQDINWRKKFAHWIRLNLFIPDAKIGWYPLAVQLGKKLIQAHQPNIIMSTSPPATTHLIAMKLSKKSKIPWVADFRDPWTKIYHYDNLPKLKIIKKFDQYLENSVLKNASAITMVSPNFFSNNIHRRKLKIIPNGFDLSDMKVVKKNLPSEKFTIKYMGSLKSRQYVDSFFVLLKELSENNELRKNIRVEFIGLMDPLAHKKILEKNILIEILFLGYLPHDQALGRIADADLLLHVIGVSNLAKSVATGKLFEYLMIGRPILSYGPKGGQADRILNETGGGKLYDYSDKDGAKEYILNHYHRWKRKEVTFTPNPEKIKKYDRKQLTGKLVQTFEELL
jgi:glycosyltransferase involved in cell wall biosynthesis